MQTPNSKTPISRCLALARYSARMLGKFTSTPALVTLGQQMTGAADLLSASNAAYEDSKVAVIQARVDVKYVDFASDNGVESLLLRAKLADGKNKGTIHQVLAPDGKVPLVKPFGQKQVDALSDLEGRLKAASALWADADKELTTISALKADYKLALEGRDAAWQKARDLRVARNVARDKFITDYVHITLAVKQLFPKDTRMQDLFFDEVERDQNEPEAEETPAGGPTGPGPSGPQGPTGPTGP